MADHNISQIVAAIFAIAEQRRDLKAQWRKDNPERAREQWRKDRRAAYQRDPEKFKARSRIESAAHHRLRKYGITEDEYAGLLVAQGGVCAICRKPERTLSRGGDRPRLLSVDHDHATGEVRGLLCHACNTAIGHLAEDPDLFARAVTYLERER